MEKTLNRVRLLRMQIAAYEAEVKDLLASLNLTKLGSFREGDMVIRVERNARFDPATARRVLSDAEFESILVSAPNGPQAKKVLGEEKYRTLQKEGQPKVLITLPDDEEED